ncbi:MAG TPA: tetratricopeptide repeat protein [Candidatus Obscuribacterales bacterium]
MGEMALIALLRKAFSASSLLVICFYWTAFGAPARAADAGSNQSAVLAAIERKLFFQTYAQEDIDSRLKRLEKRIFGQSIGGTPEQRLTRLAAVAQPQVDADAVSAADRQQQETAQTRPSVAASAARTAKAGATNTVAAMPAQPDPDEYECAIERARVSVQAAKEEEIRQLLAEGVELWRAGRGQEAIEKFEQVIRLDPHNAEAHFSMGIIEETQGNLVEAASSYRLAAKVRPDNPEYRDAIAAVEKKLAAKQKVDSKQSEIRQLAEDAIAAYKRQEYLSALDLYKSLDQKVPNQHLVKYNIGTLYLILKQPDRALEYYKQARKLNPQEGKYIQVCNELEAVVQRNKDQLKEQAKQYKESIGSDPASPARTPMAGYGILGRSGSDGVVVTTVGIASRASKIGLQRGDIIRAIDGTVVKSINEANELLSRKSPGAPVQMVIQRNKQLAQVVL